MAFKLAQNGMPDPGRSFGNAYEWDDRNPGATNGTPARGAIAQWEPNVGRYSGPVGHVAYVEEVGADFIITTEDNYGGGTRRVRINRGDAAWPSHFIHLRDVGPGGGGFSDGSFVRATDNGEMYRIAGGAPIYVSNWNVFGGSKPATDVSRAQLISMRQYPADGTFVSGAPSGRVFRFAGGAPHYVSTWNSFGGVQPTIVVDDFTLDRPDGSSPLNHVRRYPADGTFISNTADGRVYRTAGGAPLYVSNWANVGGEKPTTSLDPWDFGNFTNLRRVPTDMFIVGMPSGRVFRIVHGGRPYYVPSWDPYGGVQPTTGVDDWAIDNCDHLECGPFGYLDSAVGGAGTVRVGGWAIDPNVTSANTRIHVYVGGPAGAPGAEGHDAGVANSIRTDVASAYPGTGNNHGFVLTVPTAKIGTQRVYVYAINAPGTKGGNIELGNATATISPALPKFASLAPSRILDTRSGNGAPTGMVPAGGKIDLQVTGRGGVPAGASAVVLNVTAVQPAGWGYLTAWPAGAAKPTASNVNYVAGLNIPNLVVAKIGAGGKVSIASSARSHILADVAGYYPAGSAMTAMTPVRVLDTRLGTGAPKVRVPAGGSVTIAVGGTYGVPLSASAAMLNVTTVSPAVAGSVTAFPAGAAAPSAVSVSFQSGQTIAGFGVVKLGTGGKVTLRSTATTDLLVDVSGWVPSTADTVAFTPSRLVTSKALTGGTSFTVKVAGVGAVPTTAKAVQVTLTAANPSQSGYLTAYPTGAARPVVSNVNYTPGGSVSNAAIVKVGSSGTITVYSSNNTPVTVDISAYWKP
ncbi:CHAP domain-containing protein [Yimella sp. cx-573]|nr:CHAP domain-containing protein [Yimella sp. cx-573]